MDHDRFIGLLWGQVILFALFGASLALFLSAYYFGHAALFGTTVL